MSAPDVTVPQRDQPATPPRRRAEAGPGGTAPDLRHARVWTRLRPLLLLSLVLALTVPALAALDVDVPGRPLLAVAFAVLVPGLPLAMALRLPDLLVTLALAVATSFTWALLQGTLVLEVGYWHPVASSWPAVPVAAAGAFVAWRRSRASVRELRAAVAPGRPPRSARDLLRARATTICGLAVLALAGGSWWWGTRSLPLQDAGALGLLPLVGWRIAVAVVLTAVVAVLALRRPRPDQVLLVGAVVLVALVGYTTAAAVDGLTSVPTAWVHVGFIQYVSENGAVPLGVDARFSWPAFWGAGAQLVALAGVPDARSFLVLAPVFSALVDLPALLVIGRAVTRTRRGAWAGVGVHLVANWYQQDYFAPQTVAFTTYLAVLATLLWMSRAGDEDVRTGWRDLPRRVRTALVRLPDLPAGVGVGTSRAVGVLLVVLVAGIVVGHQLTPITLVLALLVFAVTGRTRYPVLWLVAALALAGWFSYGATDFWRGHLAALLGDVGQVGSSVGSGVTQRLTGDVTYQRSQYVRVAWSGLLLAFGMIGAWSLRRRSGAVLLAGLALAPFGILAVQSYGGEGVIRCFLFASPVLAPLAVVALRAVSSTPERGGAGRAGARHVSARTGLVRVAALVVAFSLACAVLIFTRGLNTAFERTTPGQVSASATYYSLVQPGDAIGYPTGFLGLLPYQDVTSTVGTELDVDDCVADGIASCTDDDPPRFIVLSATQDSYGVLVQGRSAGWVWRFGDSLVAGGDYRVLEADSSARLLERTP
ncbi:serine/threonine protein kinase [Kineococcus rubinsiae]|uniref:serine/threonine protein kinase n=1 Tax=Kineococcus rubinsiae TaxID=2609562 RepID=UPI001430C53C|nr:serine/threonine protein kinase [Kineococcus rubinsiae]NIZ92040.1 serine/threonine protein kinase [Kineococcus rubinsiae]